ncbi:cell division protein ZipA C-terminal FtsZ-binding domain-containing protein [Rhodoferax saidenbachensis]|uniref:Cell division protein ZipA n=1 Tax=Rhodoferax saidenbachensis TaxID=1484693 RepID=A0A1P8K9U2_9BURK|nr:cell division protein ZipA C-terminal FtsZ-binding domain-containing protein [Rhodoferax saidenbachensis]APW42777.1 cell division protein FtsZ [Rhodoferax saidenbachensis]
MSNLQIGLAVAGGLVLAAVVAHGAWTSRKNAPRQALPDSSPADLQAEGQEPALTDFNFDAKPFNLPPAPRRPVMDSLIDVIATVALDSTVTAVSGEAALAAMPATRRAGSKPFAVEGYNLGTLVWESPAAGQRYGGFQAGVQLANRTGALNEIEYSEFVVKTQAFADAISATPEFPEMLDEVARARELDQFASAHDAQLGFCIRARNASWSPGYVQQNAARLGFVAGAIPGRMVLPSSMDGLPPLLVLSFDSQAALAEDPAQSAIRELALHLDVAQVDRAERPFERMREAAGALASAMEGVVTDDNGQPLASQTMDVIGTELQGLYDTLEQRDLAAGSPLARRLFS